jgi:hypothetical protein
MYQAKLAICGGDGGKGYTARRSKGRGNYEGSRQCMAAFIADYALNGSFIDLREDGASSRRQDGALSRNLTRSLFHAAFLKTTNSVLVAAMR